MDFKIAQAFIDLAKKEGVSELKFENEGIKIEVKFPHEGTSFQTKPVSQFQSTSQNQSLSTNPEKHLSAHEVKSPFVGTFYASPSPGEPAYVKVGDQVKKGQVLCILEAMKIMNEIEADVSGEILEICVDDESLVEFAETLFKIREV